GGTPTATFASANVGTGIAVTVSGYTISGGQSANYTLTQPTGLTANITAKALTVTGVTAGNKPYDGGTTATLSTTGAALSGVVTGDTVTLGTSGATGTFAQSSVGTGIAVTVSGLTIGGNSAGNYTLTQPTGLTASITPATLTVTANNGSRAYGASSPTFTASYSGFVNGETQSVLSGSPNLTTTATASSPVGSYPITAAAGTLTAADYTFTFVNGTLTVNQAVLTVTANHASRTYGVANPTFTAGYSGFVNGDTQSVVSGSPNLTTTAVLSSPVGSYPVTAAAGTLSATNYSFTFVNGTLTVNQAGSTTVLSVNKSSANPGDTVTLTATVAAVSGVTGTPTGSVSFYDGTTLLNSTAAPLSGGTATYSTTTLSASATHQLTAVYSGDTNFTTSTSSATSVVVAALDFTVTASGSTSQTIAKGSSASFQFAVAPLYGSYPAAVSFSAAGLPTGATATFSPTSIATSGGQQTVTMTIQTSSTSAMRQAAPGFPGGRNLQPFALAFLLLLGIGGMRRHGRNLRRLLCIALLLIGGAATLLTGCGGHSSPPVSYTVTATATSGTLQHSTTFTLTVQ
ncbi:MAG: MBG domain-containing protein, partial [Terracidiphilus sp.]